MIKKIVIFIGLKLAEVVGVVICLIGLSFVGELFFQLVGHCDSTHTWVFHGITGLVLVILALAVGYLSYGLIRTNWRLAEKWSREKTWDEYLDFEARKDKRK